MANQANLLNAEEVFSVRGPMEMIFFMQNIQWIGINRTRRFHNIILFSLALMSFEIVFITHHPLEIPSLFCEINYPNGI